MSCAHAIDIRWSVVLLSILLVVALQTGCSGSGHQGIFSGSESVPSRTKGTNLEFMVHGPAGEQVRYMLKEDGTLSFSGGRDVTLDKVSWTGELTDEEIQQVLEVIQSVGWYDSEPTSLPEGDEYVYTIEFGSPQQSASWTVTGDSPDVRPVYVVLDRVSRKRFDSYLDRLPKASLDQHMKEMAQDANKEESKTEP